VCRSRLTARRCRADLSDGCETGQFERGRPILYVVKLHGAVTSVTPASKSSVSFYWAPTLTASASSLGTASQIESTAINPPSLAVAFGAQVIPVGGTASLTVSIANPASNSVALAGVAFSNTLPAGLRVASSPGVTNSRGGTVTASAGANIIALSGGSIPQGGACSVVVNVMGSATGSFTDSVQANSNGGASNTAIATLQVQAVATHFRSRPRPALLPVQQFNLLLLRLMPLIIRRPLTPAWCSLRAAMPRPFCRRALTNGSGTFTGDTQDGRQQDDIRRRQDGVFDCGRGCRDCVGRRAVDDCELRWHAAARDG
jgi:uncharacterized repeat protein (TIGR01451 family)